MPDSQRFSSPTAPPAPYESLLGRIMLLNSAPPSPAHPGAGPAPGNTRQTHIPSMFRVSDSHSLWIPVSQIQISGSNPDFQIVFFTLGLSKFCAH